MSFTKSLKKHLLFASVPGYAAIYAAKQVSEHGVAGACKEEIKKTPGINLIYNMGKEDGKYEGKKEGYKEASIVYGEKLLEQAEKFRKEKGELKEIHHKKDILMKEYEEYMEELEESIDKLSKEKRELLDEIKRMYKEIKYM